MVIGTTYEPKFISLITNLTLKKGIHVDSSYTKQKNNKIRKNFGVWRFLISAIV